MWNNYFAPIINTDTFGIMPMNLRPLSRGTVRLRSADYSDKPVIDPQYLSNVRDVDVLVEAMKIALAWTKTSGFEQLGARFYNKTFPGCEGFTLWTDDYWACTIRQYSTSKYQSVVDQ